MASSQPSSGNVDVDAGSGGYSHAILRPVLYADGLLNWMADHMAHGESYVDAWK